MHSTRFLPLFFCLIITASQARTWIDNQGRALEAEYVSHKNDEVLVLRGSDKQKLTLKLSALSESDQAFVSRQRAATPNEVHFALYKSRLKHFMFGGQICAATYLGAASIIDRPLGKLPFAGGGLSLGKDGAIIASCGTGTTPHMRLVKWSPAGGAVDIVPFTYTKFDRKTFSLAKRAADERAGRLWFFGGRVAHDGNDQVLFTLGACCDNGIFRVESDSPVQLRRLNECGPTLSLQVPPWDSRHAYIATGKTITRFELSSDSAALKDVVFSIEGEKVYLSDMLMLSEKKLIAKISLSNPREITGLANFGIYIDLDANGYYLLSDNLPGAMALAPDSSRMIRLKNTPERHPSSVSEFEIKF